jgi:hypothetical protein
LGDCNNFLTGNENWAERAAKLGWDAPARPEKRAYGLLNANAGHPHRSGRP